jgi:hypothetical protein
MNALGLFLIATSLAVLGLGAWLYRITGQHRLMVHTFFGSFGLLFAAYHAVTHRHPEWAWLMPFFITMLFGGRAIGAVWRARNEDIYREPSRLLCGVAALSFVATLGAWIAQ